MFERLVRRAARLAKTRAAARREEMAERLRVAVPGGIGVDVAGETLVLSGRGLSRRMASEAELRWLVAEVRDGG
jgi:hypothetical protein